MKKKYMIPELTLVRVAETAMIAASLNSYDVDANPDNEVLVKGSTFRATTVEWEGWEE